jgi:hypothetical protein
MRIPRSLLVLVLAALLLPWPGSTSMALDECEYEIAIQASPKTIVLFATRKGNWVTVHADIPYADVDLASLRLVVANSESENEVEVDFAKPDDLGDLVAKVRLTKLRDTLIKGTNFLTLTGWYATDDCSFTGDDTVFVRAEKGKKQ